MLDTVMAIRPEIQVPNNILLVSLEDIKRGFQSYKSAGSGGQLQVTEHASIRALLFARGGSLTTGSITDL